MQIKWSWKVILKVFFNKFINQKEIKKERLYMRSLKLLNFHKNVIKTSILAVVK